MGTKAAELYNLSDKKSARLSKNLSNTDSSAPGLLQIVNNLTTALSNNNDPKVIQLSSKIKGKFVSIFLSFGDFYTPFKKDVISLQRTIIPLLYCTGNPLDADAVCLNNENNTKDGTLAYVNSSKNAFNKFKAHFPSNSKINVPKLLGWSEPLTHINNNLISASNTVIGASDLTEAKSNGAHINAEAVRDSYYNLIAIYEGRTTVMTRMDEYHAEFGRILKTVIDGNVSNADVILIRSRMPSLQKSFDNLSSQVLKANKVDWDIEGVNLPALLNPQQENINQLSDALSQFNQTTNDNSLMILQHSKALKKEYIPLFKVFGDF